jgi:aconitate hydratase
VVDLAACRSAMARLGGDPGRINPQVRVDLVIDHSVQVDVFGTHDAIRINAEREFERNRERYEFLKWGKEAFDNFRVVPPATGIVHQVNLEFLAECVMTQKTDNGVLALPDTLVGTDSHTTMINGLGVVGWGVGGIEAEAVMLGPPVYMLTPDVVGFKLTGRLREGSTATDLVLRVTELLRAHGVVGKFVEFYGPGLDSLTLPDRATIANMAPEYGATMGFFPIDGTTLKYLRLTGRSEEVVDRVERYCKAQGLWRSDSIECRYTTCLGLDVSTVEPSLAGPKRPQDRIALSDMLSAFRTALSAPAGPQGLGVPAEELSNSAIIKTDPPSTLQHGHVVIAAITSCTNTSNPSVLVAAGLVAKRAVELGLQTKPWVKTSLAPGSRVVTDYLDQANLTGYLEALGFHTVGYGCTTCIGNSGPLAKPIVDAINEGNLVAASVLSGNRNFEGRISPHIRANYLASPPLVVAYAIAGTVEIDLTHDPLGQDKEGNDVFLRDLWPTSSEINDVVAEVVGPESFRSRYGNVFDGNETWNAIPGSASDVYPWSDSSTYIQEPPFFIDMTRDVAPISGFSDARCLLLLGDSVTTDHISPAGAIPVDSPAGQYLIENKVEQRLFNSYGSRRGNDRVMTRGTFANVRIRNQLAPGTEGGWTTHLPSGEVHSIYEASLLYKAEGTPLVVLAGEDYGMGSSRDWAAKGTLLLGVKAVIATSYERIHRSNLVFMGVLPLEFKTGESVQSHQLDGTESFSIVIDDDVKPGQTVQVSARRADGSTVRFDTTCRIDSPVEVDYYRHGGILHWVLRDMLKEPVAHSAPDSSR